MSAKLSTLLKQVNAAATEVVDAIRNLDGRILDLQERRQKIGDAPVTRSEFLEYLDASIGRKAGSFGKVITRQVDGLDISFFAMKNPNGPVLDLLTGGRRIPEPISEEACYWYLKPAIMARMGELAEAMDFPEEATPIERRHEMIAEIDAEIQRLRNERHDLASQLQKAGLVS